MNDMPMNTEPATPVAFDATKLKLRFSDNRYVLAIDESLIGNLRTFHPDGLWDLREVDAKTLDFVPLHTPTTATQKPIHDQKLEQGRVLLYQSYTSIQQNTRKGDFGMTRLDDTHVENRGDVIRITIPDDPKPFRSTKPRKTAARKTTGKTHEELAARLKGMSQQDPIEERPRPRDRATEVHAMVANLNAARAATGAQFAVAPDGRLLVRLWTDGSVFMTPEE